MAQSIKGKTAVVTGAGSGINLEFARLLLQGGCNVLIADLSLRPEAEELVQKYSSGAPKAVFHKTDVSSWADLDSMMKATTDSFGAIDIVCPGAGIFEPPWSAFWHPPGTAGARDTPDGDRYKLLDINVTHPIRVTQLAISHFLNADPPCSPSNPKTIVHIASIAGESASIPFPLYHASKWAIVGFCRSLAPLEEKIGVRVAAVLPGVVKTPLWTDNLDKVRVVKEGTDEWVTPEGVAEVMLAIVEKDSISSSVGSSAGANSHTEIPISGGSMLEVSAGEVRDVPLFMNAGPYGARAGVSVSNIGVLLDETYGLLQPGFGKT